MQYCTQPFHGHPCRKCVGCLRWRKYQWKCRTNLEFAGINPAWFLTLTFRSIRPSADLKSAWQKYIKRLRKSIPNLRYLVVMERGSKKYRLHLHALIHASNGKVSYRDLKACWDHGFFHARRLAPAHIKYVLSYAVKKTVWLRASQKFGEVKHPNLPWPPFMALRYMKRYSHKYLKQVKNQ